MSPIFVLFKATSAMLEESDADGGLFHSQRRIHAEVSVRCASSQGSLVGYLSIRKCGWVFAQRVMAWTIPASCLNFAEPMKTAGLGLFWVVIWS